MSGSIDELLETLRRLEALSEEDHDEAGAEPYRVQVLLPHAPQLDPHAVHAHLRRWRQNVDLIASEGSVFGLAIPAAGALPIMVQVFASPPEAFAGHLDEALAWSQTWRDRQAAVRRCRASIVVAMTADPEENHAIRLLALLAVLDTVLVQLGDLAEQAVLHWMPSKQVLPFEQYRMLREELGPCGPAVQVRIANVGDAPGQMFADTLGLAPLGLPDLQTRFVDRDLNEVALRMHLGARDLFLGQPLDFHCEEAASLALPDRPTLTVRL